MLSLYFESGRGGGGEVTHVEMMAEGIARVSFKDFECKTDLKSFSLLVVFVVVDLVCSIPFKCV